MGKSSNRSTEYFFTGNYFADDDNDIDAIGFGGYIYARGGNDYITLGSIAAKVYTGTGNDTVVGGAAYLGIEDSTGHLTVKGGGAGYADIDKSGDGDVLFSGAAGGVSLNHTGNHGELNVTGAAVYNEMIRKGLTGDVNFKGAGGYMLSQLQYSHNTTVRRAFDRLAHTEEYSRQELVNWKTKCFMRKFYT
ncbi:hypothetical protein [Photorhabdus cinerea]|uniref:hypothetical protein n=1 Tax=Photorhabdus cinerea TaxID=471575 RepID=UPI001A9894C6|nr:hypothetical protein [Photorhabdus cinerea]